MVTSAGTPGGETTFEVPFDLHAGKYRVCVWGDYVRKGATADVYYNTADLSAVTVIFPYTGSTDARDAFSGCAEIDLTPYRDRYFAEVDADVTLQRACGKFRIRTNDLAELAARRRTLQESPGRASGLQIRMGSGPRRRIESRIRCRRDYPACSGDGSGLIFELFSVRL